jgi:hypothetical protein
MSLLKHERKLRMTSAVPRLALCVAAFFVSMPARADDSSAALGAGGLVLNRSADIRMSTEELRISPNEISARQTFINDSNSDIDTIVAFPLPDIDTSRFSEEPLGSTTGNPLNFVGFHVAANGRDVPFQNEQRAFYKGRDVSALLVRAGVPLNIVDPRFTKTLDGLAPTKRRILEAAELVDRDSGSYEHPHWVVRTRFWWRQHFPVHSAVTFDQHYRPVTGQSLFGAGELKAGTKSARYWLRTYCMDGATRNAAAAQLARNHADPQNGNLLVALTTDYVLATANNWKGPIGQFSLVLDKLKPENLLSLCWAGALRQTGPTTFSATRQGFAPQRDIRLLVLQQAPP